MNVSNAFKQRIDLEQIPDTDEGNLVLYHELARIERSTELMKEESVRHTRLLIMLSDRGLNVEPLSDVMKPFSNYKNFQDCVNRNSDKDNPKAYCASIMRRVEGKE